MTIFDLVYEVDHENLLNIFLNPKPIIETIYSDSNAKQNQISFFAHLKRGGVEDHHDTNSYELVKFMGYFSKSFIYLTLNYLYNFFLI